MGLGRPSKGKALRGQRSNARIERDVGISAEELCDLLILAGVKGFGPQKCKALYEQGVPVRDVVEDPAKLPVGGKRGPAMREGLAERAKTMRPMLRERALRQIETARKLDAQILTYGHPSYPRLVFDSNNPVPVLYVRGSTEVLGSRRAVACVGSRAIRDPYARLLAGFARSAVASEFAVVSGFATGADTIAHTAARDAAGATVCVMPGGLDRPFPPENRDLWRAFLEYSGAALVSEFPFGMPTSALTLRKRNKLIVSFALGVVVGQSSSRGGAMNAYRFAVEQHKPIATFDGDGSADTSGNDLISGEPKVPVVSFQRNPGGEEAWAQWLQRLSFST